MNRLNAFVVLALVSAGSIAKAEELKLPPERQILNPKSSWARYVLERAKLGPFYARWKAEFGTQAWDLLEKSAGKLG